MIVSMVERVAKALEDADMRLRDKWITPKAYYRGLGRAAIEAMREPTDAMDAVGNDQQKWGPAPAEVVWKAMIDEALRDVD